MTTLLALLLIAALLGVIAINTTPRPAGQEIGNRRWPAALLVIAAFLTLAIISRMFFGAP
jgi:hypothetical protein